VADFNFSRNNVGAVYPIGAIESSWDRLEPLITPELLCTRFLFGIPLVSRIKDPITGKYQVMTQDIIKDFIDQAVSLSETELGIDIFPLQRKEKISYDVVEFRNLGYVQLSWRPINNIESMSITMPNEQDVFDIPLEWVDCAMLYCAKLHLMPLTLALKSGSMAPLSAMSGGAVFLSLFSSRTWVPHLWSVRYTTGFPNGNLPKPINQYIGVVAAMEILSVLAATYARYTSTSLSIDAISESVSTPGPQLFRIRLEELASKREWLCEKLKAFYGLHFLSNNV
jgi:hypothetical protein